VGLGRRKFALGMRPRTYSYLDTGISAPPLSRSAPCSNAFFYGQSTKSMRASPKEETDVSFRLNQVGLAEPTSHMSSHNGRRYS
jgi:hypothetical protein